jgi:hypothetical protein
VISTRPRPQPGQGPRSMDRSGTAANITAD